MAFLKKHKKFVIGVALGVILSAISVVGLLTESASNSYISVENFRFAPQDVGRTYADATFRINKEPLPSSTNINITSVVYRVDTSVFGFADPMYSVQLPVQYNQTDVLHHLTIPGDLIAGDQFEPGTEYYTQVCVFYDVYTDMIDGSQTVTSEHDCSIVQGFTTFHEDGSETVFDEITATMGTTSAFVKVQLVQSPEYLTNIKIKARKIGDNAAVFADPLILNDLMIGDTVVSIINGLEAVTEYEYGICYTGGDSGINDCSMVGTFITLDYNNGGNGGGGAAMQNYSSESSGGERRRYAVVLADGTVIKSINPINIEDYAGEGNESSAVDEFGQDMLEEGVTLGQNYAMAKTAGYEVAGGALIVEGIYSKRACYPYYYFKYGSTPNLGEKTPLKKISSADNYGRVFESIPGAPGSELYYKFVLLGCDNGRSEGDIAYAKFPSLTLAHMPVWGGDAYEEEAESEMPNNEGVTGDYQISISVDKVGEVLRGEEITYKITISADGVEGAEREVVTFWLPNNFKFAGSTAGIYDPKDNSIVAEFGRGAGMGSKTIFITAINKSRLRHIKEGNVAVAGVKLDVVKKDGEIDSYYAQTGTPLSKGKIKNTDKYAGPVKNAVGGESGFNVSDLLQWLAVVFLVVAILWMTKKVLTGFNDKNM